MRSWIIRVGDPLCAGASIVCIPPIVTEPVRRNELSRSANSDRTHCNKVSLLDHLVSAQQDRWGQLNADGFGGLEINDQLDLRDPHPCALTQRQLQLLEPR